MLDKPLTQRFIDPPFITPVATQIKTFAGQHQRALLRLFAPIHGQGHQTTGRQGLAPMDAVQCRQYLRRQQHDARLQVALGRQRQRKIRFLEGLEHIQANMPVAQLMAGQCSSEQNQRIIIGRQLMEERHECLVQGTQPAALDPARQ
ncbi:hypothetical protein D3C84_815480 [compost metagenome]